MPIEGRNLREVTHAFKEHLNALLSHTITLTPLVAFVEPRAGRAAISFRQHGLPSAAILQTKYGPMQFYLGQICDVVEGTRERLRLRTIQYQYTLKPPTAREPALRWEYDKFPDRNSYWCRHHVQGPASVDFDGGYSTQLNDMHLPTGWVAIEEVIRFCIVDLAVPPLDKDQDANGIPRWHTRLQESYETFKTRFATLGEA
jgi:hypothetical protein